MKNDKDEVKNKDEAISRLNSCKNKIKEESVALSSRLIAQEKSKKVKN